jgi:D-glycero-alpha-D-manno-heptose 1-phosphate guanylyltransferase
VKPRVLILCGGQGTRLHSISKDCPKCLMEVNQRPFLLYLFDLLKSNHFREIVLCTGYGHDCIEKEIGNEYQEISIKYSRETSPLGTGGAIIQALETFDDEWFLLMNGDSYCSFDLSSENIKTKQSPLIFVHQVRDVSRFGEVQFDDDGMVFSFKEKNRSSRPGYINAGIYWLHRSCFDKFPKNSFVSMEKEILPSLLESLEIVSCHRGFIDIGTPESFAKAEDFFKF